MEAKKTSEISGFYTLSMKDRGKILRIFSKITPGEIGSLRGKGLSVEDADRMVENVIGLMQLPLGIAMNFLINGKDYLVPMATEEPSVIAAASNAAKIARKNGGFKANSSESVMIGQIQLSVKNLYFTRKVILNSKERILEIANAQDPYLVSIGGGAKDLEVRTVKNRFTEIVVVHLLVDCKDAMGANAVNTMCEAIAPFIEDLTKDKARLKVISNLSDRRLATAEVLIKKGTIGGEEVVDEIVNAYEFALVDPYRAATHNKGIMNGITAVTLATGNDTRAIEAGAHAYAARLGRYSPLTTWAKTADGDLHGKIELPIAAGIVGGATSSKIAKICLKILNVKTARELAQVMAAVGLAQNFAALKALATEGIQKGHMRLHAKNIAQMAGAKSNEEIDEIAGTMIREGKINFERARELLRK